MRNSTTSSTIQTGKGKKSSQYSLVTAHYNLLTLIIINALEIKNKSQ